MSVRMTDASDEEIAKPVRALVLYKAPRVGARNDSLAFATVHDIVCDGKSAPRLLPAQPLATDTLETMLITLQGVAPLSYIPPEVLAQSKNIIIWWRPASTATLYLRCVDNQGQDYGKLPLLKLTAPMPALLFRLDKDRCALSVCALRENVRPTPTTPLFRAPFANVYDDGAVCLGTVERSNDFLVAEHRFFASEFTHDVGSIVRIQGGGSTWRFWQSLAKSRRKTFPLDTLIPTNRTLAGWLKL